MYQSIVRRSLMILLALLMVTGMFTICAVGVGAGETVDLKLKTFTGQQLFEAAQNVGMTNEEDMPIFTSYQDAVGRRSLMPENWMIHSAKVPHVDKAGTLNYQNGDTLQFVIRVWAEDTFVRGDLAHWEFAYNAFRGRDDLTFANVITHDAYEAAEERVDPDNGLPYKEFSFEITLDHEDFNNIEDSEMEGQFRVKAQTPAAVTVYFLGAYNKTTGITIEEYDGIKISAQGGIDGYYEDVFPNDSTVSGVASYASDHDRATGRDWNVAPFCFNAYGANADNPYLLLEGLGAELPAGVYAFDIELSSVIALITLDKAIFSVYDGETELTSKVITEAMVNATAGKDTGAYGIYRVLVNVPESNTGHKITFKFFLFDSNDIKIRNVTLYKLGVEGPIPDDAKAVQDQINALVPGDVVAVKAARAALDELDFLGQAWVGEEAAEKLSLMEEAAAIVEAIAGLGSKDDLDETNYTQMAEALQSVEKQYNDFVKKYGRIQAEELVTNAQALTDYRAAYDAVETAAKEKIKDAAIKNVEALITAIGEVTQDNYTEKEDAIMAAEEAIKKLEADYDSATAALVSNKADLEEARRKLDEYKNKTAVTFGDINNDTKIDAADALMALQSSVKLITLTEDQVLAANVDANDKVDATDALMILQCSVNLIKPEDFPAAKK